MKIIVLGGTGFIGRSVCEQLIKAGHEVSVPTRKLENARALQMLPRLTPLLCNVHDEKALKEACVGHELLINLIAILHGSAAQFDEAHVALPRKIIAACQATQISRIIHISSLGADHEQPDASPSNYMRSKGRGEQLLMKSGLNVQVLRPSIVFGAEDRFLNLFAALQAVLPVMALASGSAKFQPVWVEDVAQAVLKVMALQKPQSIYELTGQEVLSLKQIVQMSGQLPGAARPIIDLPPALGRAQAWLMQRLPGPTLMSSDNLDSMKSDNIASGRYPNLKELGLAASSLRAIAPTYLRPKKVLNQFRRHAGR